MNDKAYVVQHGLAAVVYINRPEQRNCINDEAAAALNRIFNDLEKKDEIDVVILTGNGDKAFSSGLDLKQFAHEGADLIPRVIFANTGWAGIGRRAFPKPLIAAVNGYAIAGGLELILSCDFAIASENAQLGFTEATLGPIADGGGCFRLPHWVPLPYAKELLLTGRLIDAHEAHRIGLVNRVVPAEELIPVCLEIAERIARNSPSAMKIMKKLISETLDRPESEAWPINDRYMLASFETEDFLEGPRAFTEKRDPRFKRGKSRNGGPEKDMPSDGGSQTEAL
jgi:enoyl-CoA hydratase/carnithine racemase